MRTHAKNAALGGGLVPVVLAIAAAIGNASQQALNLGLQGIALAIYVGVFMIAAAIVVAIALKTEGQKAIASLGTPAGLDAIAGFVGDLFGGGSAAPTHAPDAPFPPSPAPAAIAPPLPPEARRPPAS